MPVPVLNVSQMRSWEQASWKAGRSQLEVIRRVGHLVAERAHKMLKKGDSVVALYGRGNNGQDVLQACRLFVDHEVHRIEAIHPGQALEQFNSICSLKPGLLLDGIFGTGLSRPLDPEFQRLIHAINESGIPVLSVDLPSGLDANTGEPAGAAVRAQVTLTLGAAKQGLLLARSWPYVGRLEVAPNIGLIDCPYASETQWIHAADFRSFPPQRPVGGHKGTFGHLAVVAGSVGYHGAAVLAARGAQRAQPGLITLFTPGGIYVPVAAQLQSVMVKPFDAPVSLPPRCSGILVGPGMEDPSLAPQWGPWIAEQWRTAGQAMVVDASALAWIPPGALSPDRSALRVITPHPGEAARLLGCSTEEIMNRRLEVVRELSSRFGGCWVVLKGYQTVIGRCEGLLSINSSGNPHLGQGGSGDVLAGWIAGLLSQPLLQQEVGRTLRYAVWRHGALADDLERSRPNWTIEDLVLWPTVTGIAPDPRPSVLPDILE
ncbi:MAG: NAD(P)H-hydrate dehydratase [Verrucomicrobiales bacterium]|nr:NAD(P)H-hydrate dehydratase [Verrucomicrobiales bacterium]